MRVAEGTPSAMAETSSRQCRKATPETGLREYLERFFALSAREEAIRQHRLYSIEIELTKRCNLECPYCYSNSCLSSTVELDSEVVKRILADGYAYGLRSVSWFGGEPLMYPKLMDVLRYAKKIGYHESILYTNASLITPGIARQLRAVVDTVAVHVDTIDRNVFAQVHYDKEPERAHELQRFILRGVKALLDAGFSGKDIRLTLTLCRPVLSGLESLFNWAFNGMELQTSIFIPIAPFGRGAVAPDCWFPSSDEIRRAYETRARCERRPYLLELGFAEYCRQYQMTMCYVTADGSVTPYAGSCRSCGNISHSALSFVLAQHYRLLSYRDTTADRGLGSGCSNCSGAVYCFGNPVFQEMPHSRSEHSVVCWHRA